MRLAPLHAEPCGCGGACGAAQAGEAAGDQAWSVREAFTFFPFPLPPFFRFHFVTRRRGKKKPTTKSETWLEFQSVALEGWKSWIQSEWAGALILAQLLETPSHVEKMVLRDVDVQRR